MSDEPFYVFSYYMVRVGVLAALGVLIYGIVLLARYGPNY